MSKRILVVDDNPFVVACVRSYLESEPDLSICGEALDGVEGARKALEMRPDLIVMDLYMPRMNGLDAARMIKREMPRVPIILFSLSVPNLHRSAGISAVISKTELRKLLPAILSMLSLPPSEQLGTLVRESDQLDPRAA